MKTFGEILRAQIVQKKLTLKVVAQAVKTHKGYISGICSGTLNPPSPKMIQRLCKALDLDLNEMLARSAFEKLPEGLIYTYLQDILAEAVLAGRTKARGNAKGW